jgi:hypothetical protein
MLARRRYCRDAQTRLGPASRPATLCTPLDYSLPDLLTQDSTHPTLLPWEATAGLLSWSPPTVHRVMRTKINDVGTQVQVPLSRAQRVWLDRAVRALGTSTAADAERAAQELRALSDEWRRLSGIKDDSAAIPTQEAS